MTADELRKQIRALVNQYAEAQFAPRPFVPGESVIPPAGKVIGAPEIELMVEASLDGWLTTGRFNTEFEAGLAKLLVAAADGQILGGHVIGPRAGELIHEVAVAMRHRVPASGIATTIHAFPNFAEIWEAVARKLS